MIVYFVLFRLGVMNKVGIFFLWSLYDRLFCILKGWKRIINVSDWVRLKGIILVVLCIVIIFLYKSSGVLRGYWVMFEDYFGCYNWEGGVFGNSG